MRRGFWRLGLFLAAWAGQTAAQVTSLQADLKVQTVWQDVWGIVQIVFLPGGKVMTVHKTGELHVYESILAKNTDYKKILDISGEVYSWWDHGLISAAVHPQFPAQPYLYISYSSEDPDTPWNDQCYPDPKKEYLTNPPDTRPYCKSLAKIVRLKVDPEFTKAVVDQELMKDWCTSTYTHHVGTLNFAADGSIIYGAGDGSHFQGLDYGMPQDACTDPNGPKDQGVFLPQKDQYLRGKFIRIAPQALLKNGYLQKDVDYQIVSKGARNPFRSVIHPKTGDIIFGDVGSAVWEEINVIPNPLNAGEKPNFGWPCVEGKDAVSEIYQNWLRAQGLLNTCAATYRGQFNRPVFQYRYGPVDPDFPTACADADASVSGLTFYQGQKLPAHYQDRLFWVDYSKKCAFWFDKDAQGNVDWSHAHAFLTGTKGGVQGGFTDIKMGPDGYMYIADYSGGRLHRVLAADDKTMDNAQQQKPVAQPPPDFEVFIDTTPGSYEWVYGDIVSYKLRTSKIIDPQNIRWRVTNGHCVKNPCTGENDCHFHEISLDEKSRSGYEGTFHPSPHPMESFIVISASMVVDGAEVTKEVITHAKTFNYKVTTAPAGFPVIVEERICMESPCIVAQMGATNPSFIVQTVNAKEDNIYVFAGWTATDTMTGQVKVVNNTNYEEVAVSDNLLVANYKPVPYLLEPALGTPQGVTAVGDFKRVQVQWTAAADAGPDFVVITVKSWDGLVSKTLTMSSKRTSAVIDLPEGGLAYTATLSWFDARINKRGLKTNPIGFETLAQRSAKSVVPCTGSDFEEGLKTKSQGTAGRIRDFGIAIVGNYPSQVAKGQKVKVTVDVLSSVGVELLVNLLDNKKYEWIGGKAMPIAPGQDGLLTIEFTVEGDVEGKELFIDAVLVPSANEYNKAFVEDLSGKIVGVALR